MTSEVEVSDIVDKEIIESFKKAEKGILPRKAIIKIVNKTTGKRDDIIEKKIEKMSNESRKYLIRISRGIYKLNPEIEFIFIGEPRPTGPKIFELSSEIRAEHAEDLKNAIKNWIDNLPEIPYYENSDKFYDKVEKCEQHPLFKDLSKHLPKSGYEICQRWEKIKKGVKEEDRRKKELLKLIEKNISNIFKGLSLQFVKSYRNLRDYECSLAFLICESIIYSRIGTIKAYRKYDEDISDDEEEVLKFAREVSECEFHFDITMDRISNMIIFEKENSAIWGETNETIKVTCFIEPWECIRVPISDIDILRKGKDETISILGKSNPEIKKLIDIIIAEIDQLEQDWGYLISELHDALNCKIFLGSCKYLGAV